MGPDRPPNPWHRRPLNYLRGMADAPLVHTKVLMRHLHSLNDIPSFMDADRRKLVTLDHDTWVDMGCPRAITMTVEPGDTLNRTDPDEAGRVAPGVAVPVEVLPDA